MGGRQGGGDTRPACLHAAEGAAARAQRIRAVGRDCLTTAARWGGVNGSRSACERPPGNRGKGTGSGSRRKRRKRATAERTHNASSSLPRSPQGASPPACHGASRHSSVTRAAAITAQARICCTDGWCQLEHDTAEQRRQEDDRSIAMCAHAVCDLLQPDLVRFHEQAAQRLQHERHAALHVRGRRAGSVHGCRSPRRKPDRNRASGEPMRSGRDHSRTIHTPRPAMSRANRWARQEERADADGREQRTRGSGSCERDALRPAHLRKSAVGCFDDGGTAELLGRDHTNRRQTNKRRGQMKRARTRRATGQERTGEDKITEDHTGGGEQRTKNNAMVRLRRRA